MTAPSAVSRVRMALAEAGYPDVDVWEEDGEPLSSRNSTPDSVWWRACAVAVPELTPCWKCFRTRGCSVETCTHPVRLSDAPLPAHPGGDPE